ncbi:MAG: response regulator transcription factor [Gammaproteobacteria bacterium]|nr:response regulator transcription factor [Gammaproteobacteria bacterium]
MAKVLLIDDDAGIGEPLITYFSRFDIELQQALRPSDGFAALKTGAFDAVILDVMLPEMDGFEVCRTIRKDSDIPILMLTARGEVMDRVVGLEIGADDYLPKPFEPRELVARLNTILRRQRQSEPSVKTDERVFDGLKLNATTRKVWVNAAEIELTSSEFDLLWLLASQPGEVCHRDDILNQLRGTDTELLTRAVDIAVSRLRKKLEPLDAIKTHRNVGYSLSLAAVSA